METRQRPGIDEIRELINKGWMTHDAMWFYNVYREHGIETANKMNLAAIEGMASVEIQRMKKAFGYPPDHRFKTFEEFRIFFQGAFDIALGKFMDFEYSFPEKNVFRWKWNSCFAFNGISKIGAIGSYQCGVILRIETWLRGMGIEYTMQPVIRGCLMNTTGRCEGTMRLHLE